MAEFEFTKGSITHDGNVEPEPVPDSTDLACEVCGVPLVYAGTGRKPKRCPEHRKTPASSAPGSRTGAGRGSGSVEQAVATLANLYDLLGMAFFLATPEAAVLWQQNVEDLQTRNRAILTGDPELTKSINRLGVKGGKFAFAAVQFSAVTPPAIVAAQALRTRADARAAETRRAAMRKNSQAPNSATGTDGPIPPNRDFFG